LPDDALIAIALSDAYYLGVLSSRVHVAWAQSAGGTLEDRERYNKSRCFDPFPFPDCSERNHATIAALAEELDALRKERLRLYQDLTLTALYNVLAKLRSGEPLTATERSIHDRGLIGVVRRLHDDLDRAVFAAYSWPADLGKDDLLVRLVALNRERAEEEWRGKIRWLRPEFQAGTAAAPVQRELVVGAAKQVGPQSWPKELPEQFKAVRAALAAQGAPARAEQVAAQFVRVRRDRVAEVLETLVSLGQARQAGRGLYAA
jgi:MmeI, target recognition domain